MKKTKQKRLITTKKSKKKKMINEKKSLLLNINIFTIFSQKIYQFTFSKFFLMYTYDINNKYIYYFLITKH